MAVTTENLDGDRRTESPDGVMEETKGAGEISPADRIVPNHQEQVNWLGCLDSIKEPLLGHQILGFDHFRDVGVAREVIQNTKSQDAETWNEWLASGASTGSAGEVLPWSVVK